jgi:ELWxxDGT repeat protein
MRRNVRVFVFLFLATLWATAGSFAAGTAELLRDINSSSDNISGEGGVSGELLSLGQVALVPVTETSSGRELWVSNGTDAGTEPLLDYCPGPCSSTITFLGRAGETGLFLMSRDFRGALSLWRSDGTRPGTYPLAGPGGPLVHCGSQSVAATGTDLFFSARAGDGCGIWKTDGTSAGTMLVRQLTFGDLNGLRVLTAVGRRVYFLASAINETHGTSELSLWVSDGSPDGTVRLRAWDQFSGSFQAAAVGSRLFFIAPAPGGGRELWSSDGTPSGTRPITAFTPIDPFVPRFQTASQGFVIQAVDGQLCFLADDGRTGREVWCSDGTPAGTRRVTDFQLASPFVGLAGWRIEKLGQRLLFTANDGTSGNRLWTTTGQPASTARLGSCLGGCPEVSTASELTRAGAQVYFLGSRGGSELWVSDGTGAGTRQVHRVCQSCSITRLSPLLGRLFYVATEPSGESALWVSDGTSAGTQHLVRMGFVYDRALPFRPVTVGDRGLFPLGDNSFRGPQPWVSDGTPQGTALVTLIGRNGASSSPRQLVPAGAGVRFLARDGETEGLWESLGTPESTRLVLSGLSPDQLIPLGNLTFGLDFLEFWRSDGTPEGTFRLVEDEGGDVGAAVALPSRVVFSLRPSIGPLEVWSTDGSHEGTRKIFETPVELSSLHSLSALDGKGYFVTSRPNQTHQIWETDGTAAGTRALTTNDQLRIETPVRLARLGATLYFIGNEDHVGVELWRADGTPGGTRPIAEGRMTDFGDLGAFQGNVYFVASEPSFPYARRLWKSDGTDAGTVALAEVPAAGTTGDFERRQHFTQAGALLYFIVGGELWRTDGTAQGTLAVTEAEALVNPRSLTVLGGNLYFAATGQANGDELWAFDGTTLRPVQDIAPGPLSSYPLELVASGGKLFFTADDGVHGREPWVYTPTGPGCTPSQHALCLGGRFRVEADWRDFSGGSGRGTAVALTGDTGYFWFFDASNVEVILKVLDGQGLNGHHWVFYGALSSVEYTLTVTDAQTGAVRRYINPPSVLGSVADTQAFGPLGAHLPGVVTAGPAPVASNSPRMGLRKATAEGSCAPSSTRLCLNDGRFAVEARWKDFQGNTGTGKAVPLAGGDTGYFWFFDASNVEVVLKVLDGRPLNGKFWVFYGALSTVEYTLTVTDTVTGTVKTYINPSGKLASVADTGAF